MHLTTILAIIVAVGLSVSRAHADAVSILVLDQHGEPVSGAVLMGPATYRPANAADTQMRPAAVMDQIDKAFVPQILIVEQGRQVNFPNSDNIRHHVYSFSKPKVFELKLYAEQPEHPIPFNNPGIVVLGCNIHDRMTGYIIVSDTQSWAQTDATGKAQLELPANQPLRIWHARKASGFDDVEERILPTATERDIELRLELKPIPKPEPVRGFGSDRFKHHGR